MGSSSPKPDCPLHADRSFLPSGGYRLIRTNRRGKELQWRVGRHLGHLWCLRQVFRWLAYVCLCAACHSRLAFPSPMCFGKGDSPLPLERVRKDIRTRISSPPSLSRQPPKPASGAVNNEDKRAAVGMEATLSGHVMTAALAVLAGLVSFQAFLMDPKKRRLLRGGAFLLCIGCALLGVLTLVSSIMLGGWGITVLYKSGHAGNWIVHWKNRFNYFDFQSVLCLAGLGFTLLSVFFGVSGQRSEHRSIGSSGQTSENEMANLQSTVNSLTVRVKDLERTTSAVGGGPKQSVRIPDSPQAKHAPSDR